MSMNFSKEPLDDIASFFEYIQVAILRRLAEFCSWQLKNMCCQTTYKELSPSQVLQCHRVITWFSGYHKLIETTSIIKLFHK